jgi:hypothetical protein
LRHCRGAKRSLRSSGVRSMALSSRFYDGLDLLGPGRSGRVASHARRTARASSAVRPVRTGCAPVPRDRSAAVLDRWRILFAALGGGDEAISFDNDRSMTCSASAWPVFLRLQQVPSPGG